VVVPPERSAPEPMAVGRIGSVIVSWVGVESSRAGSVSMDTRLHAAGRDWASGPEGERRLAVLRTLADLAVPSVAPPRTGGGDPAFWARRASDLAVDEAIAGTIATRLQPADADGLTELLDALAKLQVHHLPGPARDVVLAGLRKASSDAAKGLDAVRTLSLMLFYGLTDDTGINPNWGALGYPGPAVTVARPPRALTLETLSDDAEVVWDADVCVVGSGAGGGVIAAELAQAGLDVVVLEAGGPAEPSDFSPFELDAFADLYWRGGFNATAEGNVNMVAGATLGGGTTVNWTNCVPPPPYVRERWQQDHGLEGLAGPDFDAHLAAVAERVSATDTCSDRNGPNQRLADGAEALGWSWKVATRNTDPATYDAEVAGHLGFGDVTGSKQGGLATHLRDAVAAGARIVTGAHADRVLTTAGRATGVTATITTAAGGTATLTVNAPTVVVACGALETPALLLRSGIGGPAVGEHLRLHPVAALVGFYPDDQRAWWGPPQTVIVDEFARMHEDHGLLLECSQFGTALSGAILPWRTGRDHKLMMGRAAHAAPALALLRDRGSGRVTIDDAGAAVVTYPLDDELDRDLLRSAVRILAELHEAAGATAIVDLGPDATLWRRGDDLESFVTRAQKRPAGAGGAPLFSAHQMGSARMGTDPATSVADPRGQLHDVAGVFIGDTSAFPTAVGSNPMLACLALARRTAHAILAVVTDPDAAAETVTTA
jgi:choline dehydrogenase-like flavoprotein